METNANRKDSFAEDPKLVEVSEEREKSAKSSRYRSERRTEPARCSRRLFVGLHAELSHGKLHKIFSAYGNVEEVVIPHRKDTAFVTMETKAAADKARAEVGKKHPNIRQCAVAHPREHNRYGRGKSHYNRYKNRTNSWRSRENDRYSSDENRRNRNKSWKRGKSKSSDFHAFNNKKRESSQSSTLSSQAPSFSSANSYRADSANQVGAQNQIGPQQLGPQFAQMNLNQQFPVNYENTQNVLALSQMDPMQQAMYNQYLLGLYGNMPMVTPTAVTPNASMDAPLQTYDQNVDPQQNMVDPNAFQQMYDAQNMFQFYQPPHPFFLPFPQYSENPYGLVQFPEQSATAEDVEGGDNPGA